MKMAHVQSTIIENNDKLQYVEQSNTSADLMVGGCVLRRRYLRIEE